MVHLHRHRTLSTAAASAVVALSLTCSQSGFGQDAKPDAGQQAVGAAALIHAQVRVVGIDAASNSVTLRGPRGNVVTVEVNPELADVKKLQIGDKLNIAYQNALLVQADKVASNGIRERVDTTAAIPASGGVVAAAHRVQVLATVQKIDHKHRLITLRGPTRTETLQVAPDISLEGLKAGDSVQAEFVSATAVHVTRDDAPLK
jgi:Cu/Ag efflux protein CusF